MTEPKFLGVIPARYASSRLPGKPLLEIGGKTMLEHVYRRSLASGVFFRVVIATDDHRIYDAAEKVGADVLMTRADHPDGSSRVAEIAAKIDTDYVINIQGDEPMLDPRMLRELAAGFAADTEADSATVCVPITREEDFQNPNIVKVVRAQNGRALYFSRSPIPYPRNAGGVWHKHIGPYGWRRDFLLDFAESAQTPLEKTESLEMLRVLERGCAIRCVEALRDTIEIDTPDDLVKIAKYFAAP